MLVPCSLAPCHLTNSPICHPTSIRCRGIYCSAAGSTGPGCRRVACASLLPGQSTSCGGWNVSVHHPTPVLGTHPRMRHSRNTSPSVPVASCTSDGFLDRPVGPNSSPAILPSGQPRPTHRPQRQPMRGPSCNPASHRPTTAERLRFTQQIRLRVQFAAAPAILTCAAAMAARMPLSILVGST